MRIDRKKLTLIIASLCGTWSSAVALGQSVVNYPSSSVGRIGDGGIATQKSSLRGTNEVDARPAAFRSNVVVDNASTQSSMGDYYEPSTQSSSSVAYDDGSCSGGCGNASCGNSMNQGCSSGCGSDGSTGWLESETLLWWAKGVQAVPLVLGGNSPSALPNTVLAGGPTQPLGTNMLVGMRFNIGKWMDCNQNFGVGARAWGILTDGTNQTYPTSGNNSTGVPFFNTSLGIPSIYRVNEAPTGPGPNPGANTGTIRVRNDLDLIASEVYGRWLLAREGSSRVDFLGGYTFVRLDSEVGLRTQVTDGINGNIIQNGTVTTTQDTFGTKNEFHGGHVGLLHELNKGRFTFSALGKVALGNVHQTSNVNGNFTVTNNASPTSGPRGLFAQSSNSGTTTRDQFTFLPEAGAKMKYQLGRAQIGVGYTMLLFPSVAMAGNQIDPNIDITGAATNATILSPARRFTTDTFFIHGLDLGLTFRF